MGEFPYWMQHGGHYRPVVDLSTRWVPSPIIHKAQTAPYTFVESRVLPPIERSSDKGEAPSRSKRRRRKFWKATHGGGSGKENLELVRQRTITKILSPEVPLAEWKAWGYYARPKLPVSGSCFDFDFINNHPPTSAVSPSLDIQEVFASLRRSGPCRWIPGLRHPALPPRPERWKDPIIGGPQLFPWELQLNPFLQHRIVGLAPVCWDVAVQPARVMMGYELLVSQRAIPLNDADKAQPATYPFVTHLYINGIADFPLEHFPWPIMIHNDHGITCADVFEAIYRDLNAHVSHHEFQKWNAFQQQQTRAAFEMRKCELRDDTVRRYDVLGTHRMFRGLEPHPNLEGWMMFLGIA